MLSPPLIGDRWVQRTSQGMDLRKIHLPTALT